MIRPFSSATAGVAALLFCAGATAPAHADTVADFYKGKQIPLIVGYGAGGTYSHYAHLMAQHLAKVIPGKPTVIVQNMPGAGGLKATNYAYNVMPKDGSALLVPPDSIIISQFLNPTAAKYKTDEFTWLGNLIESNSVVAVRADSGVRSIEDAKTKEAIMASTGTGSQTFLVPATLNGVFGARFKIVMGYKGSAGSLLAIEQNEAQGVSLTWLAFKTGKPDWYQGDPKSWKVPPIIQVGFSKEPDLPHVPLARDLAKNKDDRLILDFVASLGPVGRGLVAPPGAPQDRVAALRAAFDRMVKEPSFVADAQKRNLRLKPKSGAEVQKIVGEIMTMSPELINRARTMIMGATKS